MNEMWDDSPFYLHNWSKAVMSRITDYDDAFERIYERLGFKTSKAMRKWYHFHIGHLVLGNKTYEACPDPAEEGGDALTMAATNPQ